MNGGVKSPMARAWIEVDLEAIAHNAAALRSHMAQGCELMAVVKMDAYGHGAEKVAARLQSDGVSSFAVATVGEGITLRECGITGDILLLGYTDPHDAGLLSDHRLTQLAVSSAYAKALDETGHKLEVHIAVDTGMHRLGIDYADTQAIESVYSCKNLAVTGFATHLASSDSIDAQDTQFTMMQIERFFDTAGIIKDMGHGTGKLHVQSSYGLFNFPNLSCDYVRAGIALYGVMSNKAETRRSLALRPALSLRARIAQVKRIEAGESVSYGRIFTAKEPIMLATVCIGYGDGVPRQMSGNGGVCLVRGRKAPIIGRICMDMLMADVTGIESASPGDVATLIGSDGDETIRCEDVAEVCGTITNDVLCRLGGRLPKVYLD